MMIKKFKISQVGEVMQQIYDAEINAEIDWFFDDGIDWKIGDKVEGYKTLAEIGASEIAEEFRDWTKIENSISALAYAVYKAYPESKFSIWYAAEHTTGDLMKLETT